MAVDPAIVVTRERPGPNLENEELRHEEDALIAESPRDANWVGGQPCRSDNVLVIKEAPSLGNKAIKAKRLCERCGAIVRDVSTFQT